MTQHVDNIDHNNDELLVGVLKQKKETAPSNNESKNESNNEKLVSFSTIEIRFYPIVLSDNPDCHYGPSIEIGWDYYYISAEDSSTRTESVADYERHRPSHKRRKLRQLYLSQVRRESMLKSLDYTQDDIQKAIREKKKARNQRSMSNSFFFTGRSPLTRPDLVYRDVRQSKRIQRAVRNLQKVNNTNSSNSSSSGKDIDDKNKNNKESKPEEKDDSNIENIYQGWWLPLSAHVL